MDNAEHEDRTSVPRLLRIHLAVACYSTDALASTIIHPSNLTFLDEALRPIHAVTLPPQTQIATYCCATTSEDY